MTPNQHPITPSYELVMSLRNSAPHLYGEFRELCLISEAYAAGADHELEACCQWLDEGGYTKVSGGALRTTRRPKPPSLKEQALEQLMDCELHHTIELLAIRQALEALPND